MIRPTSWALVALLLVLLNCQCAIAAVEASSPDHEGGDVIAHRVGKGQYGKHDVHHANQNVYHEEPPMRHLATSSSFAVAQQFQGIGQRDTLALATGESYAVISGAASRTTLVSIANEAIRIQTKQGATIYKGSFSKIFKIQLEAASSDFGMVKYDEYADRFVIAAVFEPFDDYTNSTLYLAVSKTGSPVVVNDWYVQSINIYNSTAKESRGYLVGGWGVGPQCLYVNLLLDSQSSAYVNKLYIITKNKFYSGGKLSYSIHNPLVALPTSTNSVLRKKPLSSLVDVKVATVEGGAVGGSIGAFLVGYNLNYQESLAVGNTSYLYIATVKTPLGSPTFSSTVLNIGEINQATATDLPLASQLGSKASIDPGVPYPIVTGATWRNNTLWVTMQVVPLHGPNANKVVAHWFQIKTNTTSNTFTLVDHGEIGGKDLGKRTFTFNPSVAVNRKGVAAFGFSASGPLIHPGAYVVGRAPTDPKGNVSKSFVVKAGVDIFGSEYYNVFSSVVVDPGYDNSFWVYNSYAGKRNDMSSLYYDSTWATVWRRFFKSGK